MTTPIPTHTHIWDGSRALPDWLTGHRWEDGQLVIRTPDGDTRPQAGWWLIAWSDGTITVASPTSGERVYGDGGLCDRLARAQAANDRIRRLAARIRQGVPWASNFDDLADRIVGELDGEQPGPAATQATEADTPARPWSTCTIPADHGPHPWHDPWPLPRGQDAHCPGRPTPS